MFFHAWTRAFICGSFHAEAISFFTVISNCILIYDVYHHISIKSISVVNLYCRYVYEDFMECRFLDPNRCHESFQYAILQNSNVLLVHLLSESVFLKGCSVDLDREWRDWRCHRMKHTVAKKANKIYPTSSEWPRMFIEWNPMLMNMLVQSIIVTRRNFIHLPLIRSFAAVFRSLSS